ncbi:hypothetical protein ACF08M_37615 [Streptomyces sp. NPDC015032]|uniref:hypothetical protein n=1 Tax=Streptomyces sp. NPDC015032 TaxID=3364937 RepID=UPI0036F7E897
MNATPRKIATATLSALSLATLLWTAQTAPASAHIPNLCANAVAQTQQHLIEAGAPTDHTAWQDVRADAQRFVEENTWNGAIGAALKQDILLLDQHYAP